MPEYQIGAFTFRVEETKPPGAVFITIENESIEATAQGIVRESHRQNGLEIAFLRNQVQPFSGGNRVEQWAGFKLPDRKALREQANRLAAQFGDENPDVELAEENEHDEGFTRGDE